MHAPLDTCRSSAWSSLFLLAALALAADGRADEVAALRCELRDRPLGIESPVPRLSWQLRSERRGVSQSAYRVLVASSPDRLEPGEADLWDSGKVPSSTSHLVPYAGRALRSWERCVWKVRVWDEGEREWDWSDPSEWTMGLLTPEDWSARWIRAPESPGEESALEGARWIWSGDAESFRSVPPATRYFRKTFRIPEGRRVVRARLAARVDNTGAVFLGRSRVATGISWEQAASADVTANVKPGRNVIALEAVNGGTGPNPAGAIAALEVELDDGSREVVVTDASWRSAKEAAAGWTEPAFSDEGWSASSDLGPADMEPWGKAPPASRPLPIFRRELDVRKPLRRALVAVCGLGHYELRINGRKVGDGALDPGWTNYRRTCLYNLYDVTSLLGEGRNALGVLLGNGMHNVTGGRYTKFTGSFGPPRMILQLRIEYRDGTVDTVASDPSWRTASGPILFSCIFGGEDHDAREEPSGWDLPDFDDSAWSEALADDGPGGTLRAEEAPAVRVQKTIRAVEATSHGAGRYVVDLGDNFSGRPAIRVSGPAGASVKLTPSERVEGFEAIGNFGHHYTYILRGEGEESWRPRFTYYGFRYLLVEGGALPEDADGRLPVIHEVAADYIHSASPRVGSFRCSNDLFNRIDSMVDWSVGSNLQSVLTDCPHREKLGWLEVAHLMGPSILYHYDAASLYRKIARDTTESQLESGLVPDIAPEYTRFSGGFFESAEWGSACVQIPWLLYRWYGDRDVLERQYETMRRYTLYLDRTCNEKGLARPGLGDWYDWTPEGGHQGHSQLTPGELTATAMLVWNARVLSRVAELLGKPDDARLFEAIAAKVEESYNRAYLVPETGRYAAGSQAAQAISLHLDLVPRERREAALGQLISDLDRTGNRQTTGEVSFRFLLLSLAEAGRDDRVFEMIRRTDPPGYGCLLEQGLKTLSERWDRPGSSLNHCMFGHIQEWFQGRLLGIRQADDSVAFERIVIAPRPVGDVTWARGRYDSPRGRIAVGWRREAGAFRLRVAVPGNATATVELPAPEPARVLEGGRPAAESPGVRFVGREGERATYHVGSGRYEFTVEEERGANEKE